MAKLQLIAEAETNGAFCAESCRFLDSYDEDACIYFDRRLRVDVSPVGPAESFVRCQECLDAEKKASGGE